MLDTVSIIITISLVIIIYKYFEHATFDIVMVQSRINGKTYLVRNLPDKQEAADLLGKLAIKLEKLVNICNTMGYEKIYEKYLQNDVKKESNDELERQIKLKLKNDIERLINNFNPDAFSETTPDAKYTSYSVNKGEKIVFCLRDKNDSEDLVKENIMTFVAIHELGHLMTKSVGHEPEFWNSFKLLLKIAIDNGLYKNIDFNSTPKDYCGVKITDTPLKLDKN